MDQLPYAIMVQYLKGEVPVILDKSIRAQAFWAGLEITNRKSQITNKTQSPISEISNKDKGTFIPDQNIRGQAWDLLLFDIWDSRLVRVRV